MDNMNNVTLVNSVKPEKPNLGYIYQSNNDEIYILGGVGSDSYVAVSLRDGIFWTYPTKSPQAAVDGLTFLGKKADVQVTILPD
jgi:hypothetical protein